MDLVGYIEHLGCKIEEINLGGGFPSKTLIKTTPKNLMLSMVGIESKEGIPELPYFANKIMGTFMKRLGELKSRPYLAFEPGRCIVSNAGIFVSRVIDRKDDKWIFIDGSTNHVPENIFFASRRVTSTRVAGKRRKFTISGRTLNTADILSLKAELPKSISIGDLLVILDCGAYTISRSNQFTLLRPPVYLIKSNGKIKKIRREENYNDIFRLMR